MRIASIESFVILGCYASETIDDGVIEGYRISPCLVATHEDMADVVFAMDNEVTLASFYADILYQANVRAVRQRWPDVDESLLPGPEKRPLMIEINKETISEYRKLDVGPEVIVVLLQEIKKCIFYGKDEYGDSAASCLINLMINSAIKEIVDNKVCYHDIVTKIAEFSKMVAHVPIAVPNMFDSLSTEEYRKITTWVNF